MKELFATLKNLNILYADDDIRTRESTVKTLQLLFKNVYHASDGQKALELFENENIHIVLLDYVMPKLDGYTVAKQIRKRSKNLPIIISSGYSDQQKLLKSIELNLVKYIIKPLQYGQLCEALEQSVEILKQSNLLTVKIGNDLYYDYVKQVMIFGTKAVALSRYEISFVELLLQKKGSIASKDLVKSVVYSGEVEQNTLRNLVYRLRKKVGCDFIQTVKDSGYTLK